MFDFFNRRKKNNPNEKIIVKPHYTRSETWNDIINKLQDCPDDSSCISAVISVNETNFGDSANGNIIVPFELSKNDLLQAAGKKYGTPFERDRFC